MPGTRLSRLRSASSNAKRAYFAVNAQLTYVMQVTYEAHTEPKRLEVKLLFSDSDGSLDYTNTWILGDEDDVFLLYSATESQRAWRVAHFRENPQTKVYEFVQDTNFRDDRSPKNKFKSAFLTKENHIVLLCANDRSPEVQMTLIMFDDPQ